MKTKTFQKEIVTADGEKLVLERTTDDPADAVTLLAQGWAEAKPTETEDSTPTLPAPPASTQRKN